MLIAVLPLALVAITVHRFVDPLAVPRAVLELALVAITVREFVDPLAVYLVVLELALVAITVRVFVDPLAVTLPPLVGFASVSHKFGEPSFSSMVLCRIYRFSRMNL